MGKINWGRVFLGGLLWWLVVTVLLAVYVPYSVEKTRSVLQTLGRPFPGRDFFVLFTVLLFVVGVVAIWLYAAIRPRYGPGPKTAAIAGLVVWFILALADAVWAAMLSLPISFLAREVGVWLVLIVGATVVGAWPYKE